MADKNAVQNLKQCRKLLNKMLDVSKLASSGQPDTKQLVRAYIEGKLPVNQLCLFAKTVLPMDLAELDSQLEVLIKYSEPVKKLVNSGKLVLNGISMSDTPSDKSTAESKSQSSSAPLGERRTSNTDIQAKHAMPEVVKQRSSVHPPVRSSSSSNSSHREQKPPPASSKDYTRDFYSLPASIEKLFGKSEEKRSMSRESSRERSASPVFSTKDAFSKLKEERKYKSSSTDRDHKKRRDRDDRSHHSRPSSERQTSPERHSSHHKHKSHDRDRERERQREKEKQREKDKQRERDKERDRRREKDREKERDRNKERHRDKDREREKDRHKEKDKNRDKDRDKNRDKDRDKPKYHRSGSTSSHEHHKKSHHSPGPQHSKQRIQSDTDESLPEFSLSSKKNKSCSRGSSPVSSSSSAVSDETDAMRKKYKKTIEKMRAKHRERHEKEKAKCPKDSKAAIEACKHRLLGKRRVVVKVVRLNARVGERYRIEEEDGEISRIKRIKKSKPKKRFVFPDSDLESGSPVVKSRKISEVEESSKPSSSRASDTKTSLRETSLDVTKTATPKVDNGSAKRTVAAAEEVNNNRSSPQLSKIDSTSGWKLSASRASSPEVCAKPAQSSLDQPSSSEKVVSSSVEGVTQVCTSLSRSAPPDPTECTKDAPSSSTESASSMVESNQVSNSSRPPSPEVTQTSTSRPTSSTPTNGTSNNPAQPTPSPKVEKPAKTADTNDTVRPSHKDKVVIVPEREETPMDIDSDSDDDDSSSVASEHAARSSADKPDDVTAGGNAQSDQDIYRVSPDSRDSSMRVKIKRVNVIPDDPASPVDSSLEEHTEGNDLSHNLHRKEDEERRLSSGSESGKENVPLSPRSEDSTHNPISVPSAAIPPPVTNNISPLTPDGYTANYNPSVTAPSHTIQAIVIEPPPSSLSTPCLSNASNREIEKLLHEAKSAHFEGIQILNAREKLWASKVRELEEQLKASRDEVADLKAQLAVHSYTTRGDRE